MASKFVHWSPKMKTGLPWQDFQHKKLMNSLEELHHDLLSQDRAEKVAKMLQFLRHYVDDHLAIEECYMDELNYPDAEEHKKEHLHFVNLLDEIEHRSTPMGFSESAALCFDLNEWFARHISTTDRVLAAFIQQQEVTGS